MNTQNMDLLDYLKKHKKGVTQREAMLNLGIGRLSARVFDLRREGHNIATDMVRVKTRRSSSTVARYRLEEEK